MPQISSLSFFLNLISISSRLFSSPKKTHTHTDRLTHINHQHQQQSTKQQTRRNQLNQLDQQPVTNNKQSTSLICVCCECESFVCFYWSLLVSLSLSGITSKKKPESTEFSLFFWIFLLMIPELKSLFFSRST